MRCRAPRHRPALEPIAPLQAKRDSRRAPQATSDIERTINPSGGVSLADVPAHPGMKLPRRLRAGVESLSGVAMDDVRVHRNSPQPARIAAQAFARGSDIHLSPGQDRHLPHEAWHVAQQKQKRVKADEAIKAEPALEAEADRMGRIASLGARSGATPPPRAAAAGRGVIQPKVIAGDTWLEPTDAVSPTLLGFINKRAQYRLRDDFLTNLAAEPVHLLDMSKKYLLGETHGDAATRKWRESTRFWSKVGKMFEWTKALPASESREVGMPAASPRNQPLESIHAYTLSQTLAALNELNVLGAPWAENWSTNAMTRDTVRGVLTSALQALDQVRGAREEYDAFLTAYETAPEHSERSRAVQAFATQFVNDYLVATVKLILLLRGAVDALDAFDAAAADAAELRAKVERMLDLVEASRDFLPKMAEGLIGLTSAGRSKETKRLGKLLEPTTERQDLRDAVDAPRERAMAENIAGAEAPLLVKVGEAHVDNLKAIVGSSVVAIHETQSLEEVTKQPPDP